MERAERPVTVPEGVHEAERPSPYCVIEVSWLARSRARVRP
jgi:hypothetical protein